MEAQTLEDLPQPLGKGIVSLREQPERFYASVSFSGACDCTAPNRLQSPLLQLSFVVWQAHVTQVSMHEQPAMHLFL